MYSFISEFMIVYSLCIHCYSISMTLTDGIRLNLYQTLQYVTNMMSPRLGH